MQMLFLLLSIISLLLSPSYQLNADVTASDTTFTMQIGPKNYTYTCDQSFNVKNRTAPIIMTDTSAGIYWGINMPLPFMQENPLEFFYSAPSFFSYFDSAKDRIIVENSNHLWDRYTSQMFGRTIWQNIYNQSTWMSSENFSHGIPNHWEQFIIPTTSTLPPLTTETYNDYEYAGLQKQSWRFSRERAIFINESLNTEWTLNLATMNWQKINTPDNPETWHYNPLTDTFTLLNTATPTSWHTLANEQSILAWQEEETEKIWFFVPSTRNDRYGMWQDTTTNTCYYFDASTKSWREENTLAIKQFPPQFPPLFASLLNSIEPISPSLAPMIINDISYENNKNEYTLIDGDVILSLATGTMTLPSGVAIGNYHGDATLFNQEQNNFWQATTGEQWTTSTPNSYINTASKENVIRLSTGEWHRSEAPTHIWHFSPQKNQWENMLTRALFTYNYQTLTWNQVSGIASWKYLKNDAGLWIWKNVTSNEEWQYKESNDQSIWHNLTNDTMWIATESGLYNSNTNTHWVYNKELHFWITNNSFIDNNTIGADLFPLLPPNCAGHAAAIRMMIIQNNLHIPGSSITNDCQLLTQLKAQASCINELINENNNLQGLERRNHALNALRNSLPREQETLSMLNAAYKAGMNLFSTYGFSINPLSNETMFPYWNKTDGAFMEAGHGAASFEVSTNMISWMPVGYRFRIGLTDVIRPDGNALYSVEIGPKNPSDFNSAYDIKMYHESSLLYTKDLSTHPLPMGSSQRYWFALSNGRLLIGKDDPFDPADSNQNILFDYTITSPDIMLINYFSLGRVQDQNANFSAIKSYPAESITNRLLRIETQNQLRDVLSISRGEEMWIRTKTNLNQFTSDSAVIEKATTAKTILEDIQGNGNTRSIVNEMNMMVQDQLTAFKQLYSNNSLHYLLTVASSLNNISILLDNYITYLNKLLIVEEQLTLLLALDDSTLTPEQKQIYINAFKANIGDFVTIVANTSALTNELITQLRSIPENNDLEKVLNFFNQEIITLEQLATLMYSIDQLF